MFITTKYLGPTNHKQSRVKATCDECPSVTIPLNFSRNIADTHVAAAQKCKTSAERTTGPLGTMVGAWTDTGMIFIPSNGHLTLE